MGSWFKTCGLSNLHITDGMDVLVFTLVQNQRVERTYATAQWRPVLVPFYAKYADYGRGSDETGIGFPLTMDAIRSTLFEMEQGQNPYHDIAVKRANFDAKLFYEAVKEHRLFVAEPNQKPGPMIDFVMFRKDIVETILSEFTIEAYVGEGGDCGYDNQYRRYRFADVLTDLPAFITSLTEYDRHQDFPPELRSILRRTRGFGHIKATEANENLFAEWIRDLENYRFRNLVSISGAVFDFLEAGQTAEATELLTDAMKGVFLNAFMEQTRRNWMPGGHEGSQTCGHHGYRVLANAVLNAIANEKSEMEEDGGYSEFD